jgi:hypothetical protein
MVSEGLIPDLFSLAIERNINGPSGYLAFGGLPPVTCTSPFTSTPILITVFEDVNIGYIYYTINIDSIFLHGKPLVGSGGPGFQYIVRIAKLQCLDSKSDMPCRLILALL